MHRASLLVAALPLALSLGCTDGGPFTPGTDSGDGTDTGAGSFEPGCHRVEGGEGYKWLADAVEMAPDGGTISLCADRPVDETVSIDKAITFQGGDNAWAPPSNQPAITVLSGGAVYLNDTTVSSSRSAFVVEDGGALELERVGVIAALQYGVEAGESTVTLTDVSFTNTDFGAVVQDGGTLTATGVTVEGGGGVGIQLDGGTGTLTDVTIQGIAQVEDPETFFDADGNAIKVGGPANLTLDNVSSSNVSWAGVLCVGRGTIQVAGYRHSGGLAGMVLNDCDLSGTDLTLTDYIAYGAVAITDVDITLDGVTIETDPETSRQQVVERDPTTGEITSQTDGSLGILAIDARLTLRGTPEQPARIAGNNGGGVLVEPGTGADGVAELTMVDAEIVNSGRLGVRIQGNIDNNIKGILDATELRIDGMRRNDDSCVDMVTNSRSCNMAVFALDAEVNFKGGAVLGSEDWGMTLLRSNGGFARTLFEGNQGIGLFVQTGVADLDEVEFLANGENGILARDQSSVLMDGGSFRNGTFTRYTESNFGTEDDPLIYRSETSYQARDVYLINGTSFLANGVTFADGEQGIYASNGSGEEDSEVVLEDCNFTGYRNFLLQAQQGGNFTIERSTFTSPPGRMLYCYEGDVSLDTVTITDVGRSASKGWSQFGDQERSEYDRESAIGGLYGFYCRLDLEQVSVDGSDDAFINLNNSRLTAEDLTLSNIGVADADFNSVSYDSAIYVSYSRATNADGNVRETSKPSVSISEASIDGVRRGDAVYIRGWRDFNNDNELPEANLAFDQILIGGEGADAVAGSAFELLTLGDFGLRGFDITGTGDHAIRLSDVTADIQGVLEGESQTGTISTPNGYGVYATNDSAVSVTGVTVVEPQSSGFGFQGGTHAVSGNTVVNAVEYGLQCLDQDSFDAAFSACENTYTDPGLGDVDACPPPCVEDDSTGGDTDTSDTAADTGDTAADTGDTGAWDTGDTAAWDTGDTADTGN